MEIHWARPADVEALSRLWFTCFGDSQQFRDWFFAERFWPEYCLTACEGDQPVAALYGLPTRLWVREKVLPAVIIGGVSTHPDWRGRGIMHQIFSRFMGEMHQRGVPLTLLHPVREDLYFSLEHYTCSDRRLLHLPPAAPRPPLPQGVVALDFGRREPELLDCYQQAILPYSGPVWRDQAAFRRKAADYCAGGAELIAALDEEGVIRGYCYYFPEEATLTAEELVAADEATARRLAARLAHRAGGAELCLKLPPNSSLQLAGARAETVPWGCMGVGYLPTLLGGLCGGLAGAGDFALAVTDPVVPQNSGTFDLAGRPTACPPQLSLSAGRLVQWLCGYRSLSRLAAEGHAILHDPATAPQLDRLLPPRACLATEDY